MNPRSDLLLQSESYLAESWGDYCSSLCSVNSDTAPLEQVKNDLIEIEARSLCIRMANCMANAPLPPVARGVFGDPSLWLGLCRGYAELRALGAELARRILGDDESGIRELLGDLEFVLTGDLTSRSLPSNSLVSLPLQRVSLCTSSAGEWSSATECLHRSTQSGIRVIPAGNIPREARNEWLPVDSSGRFSLQSVDGIVTIIDWVDELTSIRESIGQLVNVVLALGAPAVGSRESGTISSLPGLVWLDYGAKSVPWERVHVTGQLVHEFAHTKLFLCESVIDFFREDGNQIYSFSPWRKRMRPARQVLHALVTFSSAGLFLSWLRELAPLSSSELQYIENYVGELRRDCGTIAADSYFRESLSRAGRQLVDAVISNVENSC